MQRLNRQWRLAERPQGLIGRSTFELAEEPIPEVREGQFLIQTLYLSFDPTQRGWINETATYLPPVQIGEVMRGGGVGRVLESKHPGFAPGDLVQAMMGWQEYMVTDGKGLMPVSKVPPGVEPTHVLSIFGITGLTAYFGILSVGRPQKGETVLVSGAAGATGSVAGQIASIKGCRVVGIAGGPEKCGWLVGEAHYDAAIDYKNEDVAGRIAELCPRGVDLYFDNVGGPILDAALQNLALKGRVVLCGGISSGYGQQLPPGPRNYMQLVIKRGRMEGFLILDYAAQFPDAVQELAHWVAEGRIAFQEDVQEGFEKAPETLNRLFQGKNVGKQLLRVAK